MFRFIRNRFSGSYFTSSARTLRASGQPFLAVPRRPGLPAPERPFLALDDEDDFAGEHQVSYPVVFRAARSPASTFYRAVYSGGPKSAAARESGTPLRVRAAGPLGHARLGMTERRLVRDEEPGPVRPSRALRVCARGGHPLPLSDYRPPGPPKRAATHEHSRHRHIVQVRTRAIWTANAVDAHLEHRRRRRALPRPEERQRSSACRRSCRNSPANRMVTRKCREVTLLGPVLEAGQNPPDPPRLRSRARRPPARFGAQRRRDHDVACSRRHPRRPDG
jgi:hypothetical protein